MSMNVSMDGLRRSLSGDIKKLRDIIEDVINDNYYYKYDLIEAMNQVITDSNVLNCVFHPNDPNFTDISSVEVEHIEGGE